VVINALQLGTGQVVHYITNALYTQQGQIQEIHTSSHPPIPNMLFLQTSS